jgi:[acyl-carrier-protein] S-malonyltransferase
MKKSVFIFPGQGAQYSKMGYDFYNNFSIAKDVYDEANDILNFNLSKIIFEGSEKELKDTLNSQLGIFVTSVAILKCIYKNFPQIKPFAVAGLSLGEYTALFASQRIDFKQSLELVAKRAKFMTEACLKEKGQMAAVLGLDEKIVEKTINLLQNEYQIWAANFNCPNQVVISGKENAVKKASELLKEKGARKIIYLQVQGAFHSGLMKSAQDKLQPVILDANLQDSNIPIVMNVPASFVTSLDLIKKYLIMQVTSSVRWQMSIENLEKEKVDNYIEIGPSKTLGAMNKKIKVTVPTFSIEKIEDLDQFIL